MYMKAAFVLGAIIASPFVFYFIWQFVAAGLYPHEQRYVHVFLPFSLGLFLAGAALAFFVVFRFVLAFLLSFYEWMGIDPDPRISDWLTFVLILPLGFGISFQLPLVMLFLERIGIFTTKTYLSNWRISVLVICFIAMVLTPSDPYSMMLMAVAARRALLLRHSALQMDAAADDAVRRSAGLGRPPTLSAESARSSANRPKRHPRPAQLHLALVIRHRRG